MLSVLGSRLPVTQAGTTHSSVAAVQVAGNPSSELEVPVSSLPVAFPSRARQAASGLWQPQPEAEAGSLRVPNKLEYPSYCALGASVVLRRPGVAATTTSTSRTVARQPASERGPGLRPRGHSSCPRLVGVHRGTESRLLVPE